MTSRRDLAHLILVFAVAACSSNNNKATPLPDAGSNVNPDASSGVDAPSGTDGSTGGDGGSDAGGTCKTAPLGAQGIDPNTTPDAAAITWVAPVTADLGDGGDAQLQFQFYSGIEASLQGTFDLTMGNQANFSSCAACLLIFSNDSTGTLARTFYQSGGTLTLTEDPFTNNQMIGTVTGLSLVEVTIDPSTFISTPVVGGVCVSVGDITLNANAAPAGWTCAPAAFNDGTTCDCQCGVHDPDCDLASPPVAGCTGTQVCSNDVCTDTCSVLSTPPVGCTTGVCGFENETTDVCFTDPTVVDPAALGATCGAGPTLCAVSNTVATGICDTFVGNDDVCRKACDASTDCTSNQVCAPIFTTKGVCVAKPANDKCQTATALTIGTPINGTTVGAVSNYDAGLEAATCTGFAQAGADVAYKVTLTAGQAITVTLSNVAANFDPSVSILGPGTAAAVCDANPVTCLAGADSGFAGAGETFQFTTTAAGTYFIIVDSFDSTIAGGSFTLTVTSP